MTRELHISYETLVGLNRHNFAEKPFFELNLENVFDLGFEIPPPTGFMLPENFPNCCNTHKSNYLRNQEWFDKFPNCCKVHKQIALREGFNKNNYTNIPQKIVNQLEYTKYIIHENINNESWYKNITDYIEYNLQSFGTPSIGMERYIQELKAHIKSTFIKSSSFPVAKGKILNEYLGSRFKPETSAKADLNELYTIFQKWLKAFPSLEVFSAFKQNFIDKVPINLMLYEESYNPYLGMNYAKIRTNIELIEILINLTKTLLQQVNTSNLIKNRSLSQIDKHEFGLIASEHQIVQEELLGQYTNKEIEYINIIKKWLKNEQVFFRRIKPVVSKLMTAIENQNPQKLKILFLTANPIDSSPLRLEDELRKVKDQIQASSKRDNVEIISESSVKITTITKSLQSIKPDIVHFSGHGDGKDGLVVMNDSNQLEYFPTSGLGRLFSLFKDKIKCVVLNACYSAEQAQVISQHGIYVIGMNKPITDKAAIDFATGFYQSIGEGNNIDFAFQIALVHISPNIDDQNTPELWLNGEVMSA